MQIHELTSKRRPVNEGPMDALKGIGTVAAQGINNALGTNIGGAAAGAQQGSAGAAQAAASKLNEPLIKSVADKFESDWNVSVASLLKQSKQLSPATIPDPQLVAPLEAMVKRFLGVDYRQLPGIITGGSNATLGTDAKQAAVYKDQIQGIIEKILKDTKAGGIKYLKEDFLILARLISASKNLMTFSTSQTKNKGTAGLQLSPEAQKLAAQAGLDAAEIVAIQKLNAQTRGTPTPAFKELMGIR